MSRQNKVEQNYINLFDKDKRIERANTREKSKNIEQYFNFFKNLTPEILIQPAKNTDLIKMLKDRGILTKFDNFSEFNIQILNFSPNYEVLEIQLQWGYYKLKANVLNILGESVFHSREFSKGANAKVYHIQEQSCGFSIKCIRNKNQQQQFTGEDKIRALKEYFLNRVASALECGPYMSKQCGFDILFTEHCVQFTMETCTNIEVFRNLTMISLKDCLQVLHRMRIVHFDIKPQNVMWSNYFKREVYIDFGLSQVFDGQPGFKYSIHFKGSPQFCSPQMSSLLFSDQIGYADIYYNDVFGLLEIFKYTKTESQFFKEDQYCNIESGFKRLDYAQQFQNDIDPREKMQKHFENNKNHLRKIIQLKYFVYTKNNDLIQAMYEQSQYKKLIFSNEILRFIKNNCDPFYLQQFYQKYIDESVKKSVEFGWIDQRVNSVYPKQEMMYQRQNSHYLLYNCLKSLSNKGSIDIDSLNRAEIEELLSQDKVIDVQVYFYCFMRYISFINNIYGVDIKQKQEYFVSFVKIMRVNIETSALKHQISIEEEVIIYKYLKEICKFIFDYYVFNTFFKNKTSIKNSKRIRIILNILQHIFFFALLQTTQALQYLNKLYELSIWSDIDRSHILLSIYTHNDWNMVSLFSTKNISFQVFQSWIQKKTQEFGDQNLYSICSHRLQYHLYDSSKKRQTSQEFFVLDEEQIDNINSFHIILWKNRFLSQINTGNIYSLINIQRLISQQIPLSHNKGIFSIYMHLLIIFDVCYENHEEYQYMCQIFKRNLRSEHFYNSLLFAKISQITKSNDLSGKIKLITHFVKIISLSNAQLTIVILCRQMDRLQRFARNISQATLLKSVDFLLLIQQLQKACLRIDYRLLSETYLKENNIASFKDHIYCYFSLKSQIDLILRRPPHSFSGDLILLSAQIQKNPNKQSRNHMIFQFIRLQLQQIMLLNLENAIEKIINLFQTYFQFFKNNKEIDEVYYHLKIYASVIIKLSMFQCKDIRLLQIVCEYYEFVKTKKMLEKYFENRQITNIISLTLLAILQFYNMNELVYFISESLKYIYFTQSLQSLGLAISEYKSFFINAPQLFIKCKIYQLFANIQTIKEKIPYTAAIYYSYVEFSTQTQVKYYFLYKVCLMMELMPLKMINYFYVQLLLLVLSGDISLDQSYFLFSDYLGKRSINQKIERKKRILNNQTVKLLCRHYQNHRNVQVTKIKIKKSKNQIKKILIDKCSKVNAFKINRPNDQILIMQPTLKL